MICAKCDAVATCTTRARWYDGGKGTFTQRDPFGGWGQYPQTLQPYIYVGNNPILMTDPSGHCYPPIAWLRNVEPTNCHNLDIAIKIAHHPNASFQERFFANTYSVAFVGSHMTLLVGAGLLTWEAIAAGSAGLAFISQWGSAYATTGTVSGSALVTAGVTAWIGLGYVDDVIMYYQSVTGDPNATGDLMALQQLGMSDGTSPVCDVAAGMMLLTRRISKKSRLSASATEAFIEVYHGTSKAGANNIRQKGIDLQYTKPNRDFGRGFYTTADRKQAEEWASRSADGGEVLTFRIPVAELSTLRSYSFRGSSKNWERFVYSNRSGTVSPSRYTDYDAIEGTMLLNPAEFLAGESVVSGGHQITWYSEKTQELLMRSLVR